MKDTSALSLNQSLCLSGLGADLQLSKKTGPVRGRFGVSAQRNFHGYPWLIHRLTYSRNNHKNLHVRGYKERGNINTPLELAIENEIDRFTLAIDVIDRAPRLQAVGAHAKEKFRNMQISCRRSAHEFGIDKPEIVEWRWPFSSFLIAD